MNDWQSLVSDARIEANEENVTPAQRQVFTACANEIERAHIELRERQPMCKYCGETACESLLDEYGSVPDVVVNDIADRVAEARLLDSSTATQRAILRDYVAFVKRPKERDSDLLCLSVGPFGFRCELGFDHAKPDNHAFGGSRWAGEYCISCHREHATPKMRTCRQCRWAGTSRARQVSP